MFPLPALAAESCVHAAAVGLHLPRVASLALLGLAGLGLMRRKKQKAAYLQLYSQGPLIGGVSFYE